MLKTESIFNTVINSIHTVILLYLLHVNVYIHKGIVCFIWKLEKINISFILCFLDSQNTSYQYSTVS